jgi:AcrR family transcriptional regulator
MATEAGLDTALPERPRRADARRNYDALVSAARQAFARCGPEATLEDIAKTAGVGIGTLYRHFPTRLALVTAVYKDDVDALTAIAEDSGGRSAEQALATFLERVVEYGATKRALFAELAEAGDQGSAMATYCRDAIRQATQTVLDRAQDAGVARKDLEAGDVLRLVAGMAMTPNSDLAQAKRLLTVVLDGLRPPAR